QPLGHRRDRRPLTGVIIAVIEHQTDSPGPRLRVVLARHVMHLPKKGGTHQTRDGSRRVACPYRVVRIICGESARASKPTRTPPARAITTGLTLPEEAQSLRPHFEDVQAHYDLS